MVLAGEAEARLDEAIAGGSALELAERLAEAMKPFVGAAPDAGLSPLRPIVVERGTGARIGRQVQRAALRLARLLPGGYTPGDLDVVRPDGALDAHARSFTLFELNAGSCVGGLVEVEHVSRVMAPWAARVLAPAGLQLRFPFPLRTLSRALALRYGASARFAWTVVPGALGTAWAPPLAAATTAALRAEGLTVDAAEADALEVRPAGVWLEGRRVDVIVRVIDAEEWLADERLAPLREAVARGTVQLFSSPYDRVITSKEALVALSLAGDPLVPWTRYARPAREDGEDLLPFVRDHAGHYVLKPFWGRQGQRVVVGREDPELFAQLLVAAVVSRDCILQRYVEPGILPLPYLEGGGVASRASRVVVSPLLVRGSPASLCARTSPLDASAVLTHPALGRTGIVPIAEVES
jgi:hypothetical protein